LPRRRSTGRLALIESESPSSRELAARLACEGDRRELRLRVALALADAGAVAIALLVTVALISDDPLTPFALLLLPAAVAGAKLVGLYESDDQRIHKTTIEELPRLAQLGIALVIGVWMGDGLLLGAPAGKSQVVLLGAVFVGAALLGRRGARSLTNRRLERERCLFMGDEYSFQRLRTIVERS